MEAATGQLGRSHCEPRRVRRRGLQQPHGVPDVEERAKDPTHNLGDLPEVPAEGTSHTLVALQAEEAHSRFI